MKHFSSYAEFKTFIQGYNNHPIPLEFSQGLSTSELIHELLGYIQQLSEVQEDVKDNLFKIMETKFNELKTLLENDTSFFARYKNEIYNFCLLTIQELIGESLKYITFTLEDGHLVAYIPDSWDNLIFDTNVDYNSDDFGKLMINY